MLVFEDLHWADDGLLDFVDHLVDWSTGVPMLVVCTTRAELLDAASGWGGGKANASRSRSARCPRRKRRGWSASLLEQAVLPAELQPALLAKPAETRSSPSSTRMLQDRGFLVQDEGAWKLARTDELPLPESVHATIAARLDALAAEDKGLLQDAAVVGKVFWLGSLVALDGRDRSAAEESLHVLARRQLVHAHAGRPWPARASTPSATCCCATSRTARSPERRAEEAPRGRGVDRVPGRAEDYAEMLAHHYLSALEYARAAGQPVDAVVGPARRALVEAGDRATALNADVAAGTFYTEALALTAEDDPFGPLLRFRRARALQRGEGISVEELDDVRDKLIRAGERELAAEVEAMAEIIFFELGERQLAYARLEQALALVENRRRRAQSSSFSQRFPGRRLWAATPQAPSPWVARRPRWPRCSASTSCTLTC